MRPIAVALLSFVFLSSLCRLDADDLKPAASDRTQVTKFFKDHVIDKTVASPKTTFKMDNNKMESEGEDQTAFTNFVESAQGFSFDMTTVNKETRYELDKDGKRVLPGRDLSGTEVYRFEIVERVSTKKLIGTARILSMTTKAPSREGAAMLITGMKVVEGRLHWSETLPGYLDFIAAGGKYKPGSWDGRCVFSLHEGKLQVETEYTNFDVDPDTLKRTPSKEKLPPFTAKEVELKPGR
jgi:hypothetical protein